MSGIVKIIAKAIKAARIRKVRCKKASVDLDLAISALADIRDRPDCTEAQLKKAVSKVQKARAVLKTAKGDRCHFTVYGL